MNEELFEEIKQMQDVLATVTDEAKLRKVGYSRCSLLASILRMRPASLYDEFLHVVRSCQFSCHLNELGICFADSLKPPIIGS